MENSQRIDFVIVIDRKIRHTPKIEFILDLISHLQAQGLNIQLRRDESKENIFLNLHLPPKAIQHFSNIYNIPIDDSGHTNIPSSVTFVTHNIFKTPLSNNVDVFVRRGKVTNKERILITAAILEDAKFGPGDDDYGLEKLIRIGAVKTAFPLHDGDFKSEDDIDVVYQIPENERQLLLKYWSNFSLWYKEQPLNLIEKYFGSEVAFYFAWCGFYNKMLIPAAIVGLICTIISIIQLLVVDQQRVAEICHSELLMCPLCNSGKSCIYVPLNISCEYAKASVVFDNHATVFFAVFMSFWATLFLNLWRRLENVLKIRWNVEFEESDTKYRIGYKEKCTAQKYSPLTGKMVPHLPASRKALYFTVTYGTCLLLVGVVILFVVACILYRVSIAQAIRLTEDLTLLSHATFLLTVTSACLQVVFIKIFGIFYSPLSEWLTELENPRTQSEFDNSVISKRYILGFANNYASLFYIAFFKSRFFAPYKPSSTLNLEDDLCEPTGCLMPLWVQLCVLMLFKSLFGNILTLINPTRRIRKRKIEHEPKEQWEKEYNLEPAGRYHLTTEFMEMVIQYGFVTFFVAAFPLAPLCALINNCLELRLDAYKLVTRYRRPVPRQQSGIGTWDNILQVITHISTMTNAFVLAFTSDFVVREVYKASHNNSLEGYIKSSFSLYDMRDLRTSSGEELAVDKKTNSTLCYYKATRFPADHPKEYTLTPKYWYELGMRLLCVIVFEHIIFLANGMLSYFIPDVPESVKQKLHHERSKQLELKLKIQTENMKILNRRTQVPIRRREGSETSTIKGMEAPRYRKKI